MSDERPPLPEASPLAAPSLHAAARTSQRALAEPGDRSIATAASVGSEIARSTDAGSQIARGDATIAHAARGNAGIARVACGDSQIARVARRAAPVARRTLQAVALTLAAEQALRAAGGVALAVVSATRAPLLPAPVEPPATQPLARRRVRTVVTEVTILERRARR